MKVTLGGDRLGSGQKSKIYGKDFNRSTHDLSQKFTSPMTPGALYPFLVLPAMRGDKFTIKTYADVITIPTQGPLFGSFKFQIDYFQCDVRLYQALLHNNPLALGLKVQQVMLPTYKLKAVNEITAESGKLNKSSLLAYLGISGMGRLWQNAATDFTYNGERTFNAVPLLAYYDIYKTYYANKQEENAYVITNDTKNIVTTEIQINEANVNTIDFNHSALDSISIKYTTDNLADLTFKQQHDIALEQILQYQLYGQVNRLGVKLKDLIKENNLRYSYVNDTHEIEIQITADPTKNEIFVNGRNIAKLIIPESQEIAIDNIKLQEFPLKNIDDMRMYLLSQHQLGTGVEVSGNGGPSLYPYVYNSLKRSKTPLNGLAIKTYQSDIYNNWVNTEWLDGENGIAEMTAIVTEEDGTIKIDEVLLKEKLYNLMNRIAVSGGTYEDYLNAAYEQTNRRAIEAPIYLGGMSSEIIFEQIVQTAPADGDPLGTLAGRGRHVKRKGGNITVKVDQPAFIIGIASLTPRISYSQGNEFYMTDLKSIFDFHKPSMDGIGFQNLMGERLAWFDTKINQDGTLTRSVVGKIPAWLEYMTAVNKTYGDFADGDKSFMVLNRNYEQNELGDIKDVTTYIDPTKYNYAFAYTELDAQNFWAEIYMDIKARRLMSAKVIPTI